MREMKFRVYESSDCGDTFRMRYLESSDIISSLCEDEYNFPMQYTGLKDRNGKEIYEGDIIRGGFKCIRRVLGIVRFRDGAYYFDCKGDSSTLYPLFDTVILGNIYENPALLYGPNDITNDSGA